MDQMFPVGAVLACQTDFFTQLSSSAPMPVAVSGEPVSVLRHGTAPTMLREVSHGLEKLEKKDIKHRLLKVKEPLGCLSLEPVIQVTGFSMPRESNHSITPLNASLSQLKYQGGA